MIYIVKHRDYENPVPKGYKEIGVGGRFKGDGENINELNPYLNEATAYYDLWKNSKDKVIGICHYRRFFAENDKIITVKRAEKILEEYDMIVANKIKDEATLYNCLRADLADGDEKWLYNKYLNQIYLKYPAFLDYMMRNKEFYPREMMITNREIFNKFCEELFDLIVPLAKKYDTEDSDSGTNPRLLGFITERFFSYLIVKNGWNVYEMDFLEV